MITKIVRVKPFATARHQKHSIGQQLINYVNRTVTLCMTKQSQKNKVYLNDMERYPKTYELERKKLGV